MNNTNRSDDSASSGAVLAFWREAGPSRWFKKNAEFDADFRTRFLDAHELAARGQLDDWLTAAPSALSLVILLDQFPRNAFRDSPRMFATDPLAVQVAGRAVDAGFAPLIEPELRAFFYMPFMHSERLADQDRCLALCRTLDDNTLKFAELHRDIIARFGRFPHRNALLGRSSTVQEQAFLDAGGFAG